MGTLEQHEAGIAQLDAVAYLAWSAPSGGPGLALRQARLEEVPARWAPTTPLADGVLFRIFAALDGSDEAFVAFANRHGPLTFRGGEAGGLGGEPLTFWRAAHVWLTHCLLVLDAIREARPGALLVRAADGRARGFRLDVPEPELLASAGIGERAERPLDVVSAHDEPAEETLFLFADHHLCQQVGAEFSRTNRMRVLLPGSIRSGTLGWRRGLQYEARHLWGGLVSQLFFSLTQGWRQRQCSECSSWFVLGGGGLGQVDVQ